MTIYELVEAIGKEYNCLVYPSIGQPFLDTDLSLPKDLKEFYEICGGVRLFIDQPYFLEIVAPTSFLRASSTILGEEIFDDVSQNWFVIARSGSTQFIVIDLSRDKKGFCYDSFWDRFGLVGEMPVVSKSFNDLLSQLYLSKGKRNFWLESDFSYLGDAYD